MDAVTANGRGKWTSSSGLKHLWPFNRDYGSAVMYETGKILVVGGGGYTGWSTPDARSATPTATAETIDLNATGPAWKNTDPMHHPRRHLNATILPDGQVLVTGGTSGGGFNDLAGAVHAAEVWDPATGHWTELAANSVDRVYHSVSLLLPDATVLHGASGDASAPDGTSYPARRSHEIFRPPYLFKGARPVITSLSQTTIGYEQVLTVNTSYAQQITQVRWIRLGSVTHAFDAGQRRGLAVLHQDHERGEGDGALGPEEGAAGVLPALHPESQRGAVGGADRAGALTVEGLRPTAPPAARTSRIAPPTAITSSMTATT